MIPLLLAAALGVQAPPAPAAPATADTTRLTITDAVQLALGQYPTVAVARANRSRAAADVGDVRSARLPRLTFDLVGTQWELPAIVYPIHGFSLDPNVPPPGGRLTFANTTFQATFAFNWTVWDFGARRGRVHAAEGLERAAAATLTAAEQALAARTATAYLRVLTARQVLAASDQRITALTAEAERARRMFEEGRGARLQVLRVEAQLARSRAERSAVAGNLDVAEHDLAQLMGLPYDRFTRTALAEAALRDTSPVDRERVLAAARATSPELAEATRRAEAAQAGLAAARATRWPELRVMGAWIPRTSTTSEVRTEWQVGAGIAYPIYTGGQRSSQIDRAEADARATAEQRRLADFSVTTAVDRAVAAVVEARSRVAALEAAVAASDAVAATERTALEIGAGTQTDYLDALTDLLREQAGLIEARHTEITARIELARVTGVLSPAFLAQHLEPR
jgi:outer membrane protein TolC